MISILFAGFFGGIIRGLVGFTKHQLSYKDVPFKPAYFISMVGLSGLIGLVAAWVTEDLGISFLGLETVTPAVALVVGYAGGDLIENIFKIFFKQTNLLPIK